MKKKIMAAGTVAGPAGIETVREQEGQEQVTADGFHYDVDRAGGGGIAITGYDGSATEVVIPGEINGTKVTGIEIPSSVTGISVNAFNLCKNIGYQYNDSQFGFTFEFLRSQNETINETINHTITELSGDE